MNYQYIKTYVVLGFPYAPYKLFTIKCILWVGYWDYVPIFGFTLNYLYYKNYCFTWLLNIVLTFVFHYNFHENISLFANSHFKFATTFHCFLSLSFCALSFHVHMISPGDYLPLHNDQSFNDTLWIRYNSWHVNYCIRDDADTSGLVLLEIQSWWPCFMF